MHSFFRMFRTAIRALRRHIMRSALTCLGIIIGVASVIAIIEIGQGTSYSIQQTIAAIGANVIQIDPEHVMIGGVSTGAGGHASLSPEDSEAILRECSAVRYAAPSVDCRMQIIYGNRNWSPMNILGTTPDYLVVRNWTALAEGEAFTGDDAPRRSSVFSGPDNRPGAFQRREPHRQRDTRQERRNEGYWRP